MKWIDATDLIRWADRIDSRSRMPELARRLIYETSDAVTHAAFPAGESVQVGGWDGLVQNALAHPFIPEGISAWEFGSERSPKAKADRDHDKRRANPGGLDGAQTTFVFVTPRRWGRKAQWTQERRAEQFWKDVKVFDADDLEQWLEQSPAVAAWFAKEVIHKYAPGVTSVEGFWEEFSQSTTIPIPQELLLAGRGAEADRIAAWFNGPPASLTLVGDSESEAVGFAAAAMLGNDPDRDRRLARAVVGSVATTLREIVLNRSPHLIIWQAADTTAVGAAVQRGHHVLVPVGRGGVRTAESTCVLPPLRREPFVAALVQAGLSDEKAQQVARETGRSITVMRRRLAVAGSKSVPDWARPEAAHVTIAVLLAGSWNGATEGDRETLARLVGMSYDSFEQRLTVLTSLPDSPVRRHGNLWSLVSPLDAWYVLGPLVSQADIERFAETVSLVMSVEDPALSLDPEQRWAAGVYGKSWPHSRAIREGLAQSLVLIAVHGVNAGIQTSDRPADLVYRAIYALLGQHPGWKRWYSVAHLLPLLAEAAPEAFLRALEGELQDQEPEIAKLFGKEDFTGGSVHPNLLWALEGLAWYPPYLSRTSLALGRLAELDPGGKLANRPQRSLREIYLLWRPETAATLNQRLEALDRLIQAFPTIGWQLLLDLLPKGHDMASPTYTPRWRECPRIEPVSYQEHHTAALAVAERAVAQAQHDPVRLSSLVSRPYAFGDQSLEWLKAKLRAFARDCSDLAARQQVWTTLSGMIRQNRMFPAAEWVVEPSQLEDFQQIATALQPPEAAAEVEWLFNDDFPDLPEVSPDDFPALENRLAELRAQAVTRVIAEGGTPGLIALAEKVKRPDFLGQFAVDRLSANELATQFMTETLGAESWGAQICGMGFVRRLHQSRGYGWAEVMLNAANWSDLSVVNFLLALPFERAAWVLVEGRTEALKERYWSTVRAFPFPHHTEADLSHAVGELIRFRRGFVALQFAFHARTRLSKEILVQVLDAVATQLNQTPEGASRQTPHQIEKVLDELRSLQAAEDELIRLEWLFLPLINRGFSAHVPTLHAALVRNPELFALAIRSLYRPRQAEADLEPQPPSIADQARASHAFHLLTTCRTIPGTSADRTVDSAALAGWVKAARQLCVESGHGEIADQHIGKLLASSPADPDDGHWPHRAVRDLVEQSNSSDLEEGLSTGVINNRGITSRKLDEGGRQERALAQKYRADADALAFSWPRTSTVLAGLADRYERDARSYDVEVEQRDILG